MKDLVSSITDSAGISDLNRLYIPVLAPIVTVKSKSFEILGLNASYQYCADTIRLIID